MRPPGNVRGRAHEARVEASAASTRAVELQGRACGAKACTAVASSENMSAAVPPAQPPPEPRQSAGRRLKTPGTAPTAFCTAKFQVGAGIRGLQGFSKLCLPTDQQSPRS